VEGTFTQELDVPFMRARASVPNQKFGAEIRGLVDAYAAEEETASGANGDDENAARRRQGAEIYAANSGEGR